MVDEYRYTVAYYHIWSSGPALTPSYQDRRRSQSSTVDHKKAVLLTGYSVWKPGAQMSVIKFYRNALTITVMTDRRKRFSGRLFESTNIVLLSMHVLR